VLFNSSAFTVFFPLVTAAYFFTPGRLRWAVLLAASSIFYMAFVPAYVLILYGMIGADYMAGILIEQSAGRRRQLLLAASLFSNIGLLAVFKYYGFAAQTVEQLAATIGVEASLPIVAWVLPIGLSFHTFQAMAYTIEVYRGRCPAERHLGIYALYVMFFPQLVAGPIERPGGLLPQLHRAYAFDTDRVTNGLKLMAWGFFKKIVIADRLAIGVNAVYGTPDAYHGPAIVVATVFFAFQIYCDFSGYSDIAIGSAEVLGIRLMTNFRRPYLSRSTREFWTRWHISLSTWFRDYVYIPLGGRPRTGEGRTLTGPYASLMITFLLSGLWHGADWTFVVWGALNGSYLAVGRFTESWRARVRRASGLAGRPRILAALQSASTFSLITVAWVFFRASSVDDATTLLRRAFDWSAFDAFGMSSVELMVAAGLIVGLCAVEWLQPTDDVRDLVTDSPAWVRWPVYYAVLAVMLVLGIFTRSQFIYFQF
jgi:D-alanyl-lipoteichoic acid acyltransferase DltB (MBOAT superfamily)